MYAAQQEKSWRERNLTSTTKTNRKIINNKLKNLELLKIHFVTVILRSYNFFFCWFARWQRRIMINILNYCCISEPTKNEKKNMRIRLWISILSILSSHFSHRMMNIYIYLWNKKEINQVPCSVQSSSLRWFIFGMLDYWLNLLIFLRHQ